MANLLIKHLDFDGAGPENALKLVKDAYDRSKSTQTARKEQWKQDYLLYSSYINMAERDPDRANVFIPEIWAIVKQKVPVDVKALAMMRPYFPFTSKRKDFKGVCSAWVDYLDDSVDKANYFLHLSTAALLKTVYGVSFMDSTCYYEPVDTIYLERDISGRIVKRVVPSWRMRMRIQAFAPWEVFVDPMARNLEELGGCRYVIKPGFVSKREIVRMAKGGYYPDFDLQRFLDDDAKGESGLRTGANEDHWGFEILSQIGLQMPELDDDICMMLRFETPERFVDVLNSRYILRDGDNPHKHKRINLSRFLHEMDAHTQNQFWGTGECKPNEVMQDILNTLWDQMLDKGNVGGDPVTYYNKNVFKDANRLVRSLGNKIPADMPPNTDIRSAFVESYGQPVSGGDMAIIEAARDIMHMTAGKYPPQMGEPTKNVLATGINQAQTASSERQELNVRLAEESFLRDFGGKAMSNAAQYAMEDDLVEVLGNEQAALALVGSPGELPGGFKWQFRGSGMVTAQMIKQRNMKDLSPELMGIPNVMKGVWAELLVDAHDVCDEETKKRLIVSDELYIQVQAALVQQQKAEQEAAMMAAENGRPASPGGTSNTHHKEVTPGAVNRQMSQEMSKGAVQ